jgi:RNA polymerase sigma factor (sigma-70 family)
MTQAQQKQLAALSAIRDLSAQISADELDRMDVLAAEKRSPGLMKQWVAVSQAFRRWWSSGAMLWPQHESVWHRVQRRMRGLIRKGGDSEVAVVKKCSPAAVDRALDRLPPELRVTVLLADIGGVTHHEMADLLRCSLGTVRSRLYRARQWLAQELTADAPYAGERDTGCTCVMWDADLKAPSHIHTRIERCLWPFERRWRGGGRLGRRWPR